MYRSDCAYSYVRQLLSLVLTLGCLLGSLAIPAAKGQAKINIPDKVKAPRKVLANENIKHLSERALSFEANHGQSDAQVKFLSRGSGYTLFLTPTEAVLSLRQEQKQNPAVLRMSLVGANSNPKIVGEDELAGKVNYFRGRDSGDWRSGVSTYAKVSYDEIYPGVDMVYYGKQRQLEYDFIVAPNSDPNKIRLAFTGARSLRLDETGDLVLKTVGGEVRQQRPLAYQHIDGRRVEVSANYILTGKRAISFKLGNYDPSRPLVIDPVINYSTYLGGSGQEEGNDIAVDADGFIYVTGWTSSVNYPVRDAIKPTCHSCQNWSYDAFVTKINPWASGDSSLVFSTFWGHSSGGGMNEGRALAIDSANNIIIAGVTTAPNFPTTPNGLQPTFQMFSGANGFITKFDATGSTLLYSTFLLGNNADEATDLAVDGEDNLYVGGRTGSTNFKVLLGGFQPTHAGVWDGFIMKFEPAGVGYDLKYSSFLGGQSSDSITNIAVDTFGHIYMTGATQSADLSFTPYYDGFPFVNGFQSTLGAGSDSFLAKIDPSLPGTSSLVYSTFLGGNGNENAAVQLGGIAVDNTAQPQVYVTGTTNSSNFPLRDAYDSTLGGYDVFITRIDTAQVGDASLIYSTFLGGAALDYGHDIALDLQGQIYVTGMTQSNNFPLTPCALADAPFADGFITVLNPAGSALVFSTYLGGNNGDQINALALHGGAIHVTGATDSSNYFNTNAYQPGLGGTTPTSYFKDATVTKITPGECAP